MAMPMKRGTMMTQRVMKILPKGTVREILSSSNCAPRVNSHNGIMAKKKTTIIITTVTITMVTIKRIMRLSSSS